MFGNRDNVVAGGLMSYTPDYTDLTPRAAVYIDKVLKGASLGELPVEQASKFQLVITRSKISPITWNEDVTFGPPTPKKIRTVSPDGLAS
jgi:ABC-type uncharacterized transport system substrate-binding protein